MSGEIQTQNLHSLRSRLMGTINKPWMLHKLNPISLQGLKV